MGGWKGAPMATLGRSQTDADEDIPLDDEVRLNVARAAAAASTAPLNRDDARYPSGPPKDDPEMLLALLRLHCRSISQFG